MTAFVHTYSFYSVNTNALKTFSILCTVLGVEYIDKFNKSSSKQRGYLLNMHLKQESYLLNFPFLFCLYLSKNEDQEYGIKHFLHFILLLKNNFVQTFLFHRFSDDSFLIIFYFHTDLRINFTIPHLRHTAFVNLHCKFSKNLFLPVLLFAISK